MAAAEISTNGATQVGRTGIAPLPAGVSRDGEVADPEALGAVLKSLFSETKLSRSVRVGVANQRIVVRTLRLPIIEDKKELETAIRFQAQDHIPMSLDQAVIDWQVVAKEVGDDERQMDVVVVAARREMVGAFTAALRNAGLKPVGIDVSAFGMIRALAGTSPVAGAIPDEEGLGTEMAEPGAQVPPRLYCSLGDVTNLAVARGSTCLFTRVSQFGIEGMAQRLAERRELTLEHARQWVSHVGLDQPTEDIEGDPGIVAAARQVLDEGAAKLADELRLSLEFYGAQEGAIAIEEVVACGQGTSITGLTDRLQRELGYPLWVGRPGALSQLDEASAARLTLSYGLGLEEPAVAP